MIVVKYGGHVLESASDNDAIVQSLAHFHAKGGQVVVVHGGGPAVDQELAIHNIPTTMASGYRVTTGEVMQIVQQTLSGSVLRNLTNQFIANGANAVGLSTGDGNTLRAKRFKPMVGGVEIDAGLVGEAASVDGTFLRLLIDNGYLPVISPVSVSAQGVAMNINGDIATGSIAGALSAEEVIFITDVPGIYRNWPDPSSLITEITLSELQGLAPTFADGMAPKVKAVITALASGARRARVIDGRLISNLNDALIGKGGTLVIAK
jgi:acetylglutamate kinase